MDQFELAYRLGFTAGDQVGYGRCMYEIHQASLVHRFKHGPLDVTQSELLRRRAEVGDACQAFTIRHGQEYTGGPVNWYTGLPR